MPQLPDKQPNEEYYITVGIEDLREETIATYSVIVKDEAENDVTATILDSAKTTKDGIYLNVWVRGGESGQYYSFEFAVVGDAGSKFEKEASMRVFDTAA